jgi:hypothetical protein
MNWMTNKIFLPKLSMKEVGFLWLIGLFFLFLILWIVSKMLRNMSDNGFNEIYKKRRADVDVEKVKGESRGETHCRKVAEKIFGKRFSKIRPDYLRNNVTGHNLELDLFNEELMLGIEVQGKQHYVYTPFFHKNYEDFMNQKYRDELKRMMCKENKIQLIEIPYDVKLPDMEGVLRIKARSLGYEV